MNEKRIKMAKLEIRRLEIKDKKAFQAYVKEISQDTNPYRALQRIERYSALNFKAFADFVLSLRKEEKRIDSEQSTATTYFAFRDGVIVGSTRCRWQIEKGNLFNVGGHIGYDVTPSYRGNGIAAEMTKFALEKYREKGVYRVLITAKEGNLASRKTIENVGGILENAISEKDGELLYRYWIELNK